MSTVECDERDYEITLIVPTGEISQIDVYTTRIPRAVTAMLQTAGVRLSDWDGIPVQECRPILESLVMRLESDPDRYRALAPEEGDYQETCNRLRRLLVAMRAEPDALVGVS